jgi:hypothetical protein
MNYSDYLHDTSRALIEKALLAAAESGITCDTTLTGIANAECTFGRHDCRAQRIWHDELYHQMRENQRHANIVCCPRVLPVDLTIKVIVPARTGATFRAPSLRTDTG